MQDHQNKIQDCIRKVAIHYLDEWGLMFEDLHMLKDSVPQVLFCKEKGTMEITMSYFLDSRYSHMIKK